MSIEYFLHLESDLSPGTALEHLVQRVSGLTWEPDKSKFFNDHAVIWARHARSSRQALVRQYFHFIPSLEIVMRRASSDTERLYDLVLEVAVQLMTEAQDALLTLNEDTVQFQRLGGILTFNVDCGLGNREWLQTRLTSPFELRRLDPPYV